MDTYEVIVKTWDVDSTWRQRDALTRPTPEEALASAAWWAALRIEQRGADAVTVEIRRNTGYQQTLLLGPMLG